MFKKIFISLFTYALLLLNVFAFSNEDILTIENRIDALKIELSQVNRATDPLDIEVIYWRLGNQYADLAGITHKLNHAQEAYQNYEFFA
ncbi:hypothetical protein [Paremcibacter congregatus]|uniref:hypothetical protein n=1 Tax=Paremcibacter congregatus TaxID=2043170 RepID=UPI003A8E7622